MSWRPIVLALVCAGACAARLPPPSVALTPPARLCKDPTLGRRDFCLPAQKMELFRAFTQIALDLRQEYVLFYTPTNQVKAAKKREIKVKLVGAEARLYHKQGYVY